MLAAAAPWETPALASDWPYARLPGAPPAAGPPQQPCKTRKLRKRAGPQGGAPWSRRTPLRPACLPLTPRAA
eukprot:5204107-Lingulodinium_polyedra.AAC.1